MLGSFCTLDHHERSEINLAFLQMPISYSNRTERANQVRG